MYVVNFKVFHVRITFFTLTFCDYEHIYKLAQFSSTRSFRMTEQSLNFLRCKFLLVIFNDVTAASAYVDQQTCCCWAVFKISDGVKS